MLKFVTAGRPLYLHLERRANNFNLIRLVAALLVMFSHCLRDHDPIYLASNGLFYASGLAMPAFFFTSGLLIAQSRDKSTSALNFLRRRFLRLYPAAVFVIVVTACLLGPLITTLSLKEYFSSHQFFRYLASVFLWHIYYPLPGVFTHSPLGPAVNPPLWSISLELKLYLAVLCLGFCRSARLQIFLLWIAVLLLAVSGFFGSPLEESLRRIFGPDFVLVAYSVLSVYFFLGCLCYYYRHRIVIHNYWLLALPVLWWMSVRFSFPAALFLLLPLSVLFIASAGSLRRLNPRADLSYGAYVWAYPIEQLIVNYLQPPTYLLLFFGNALLVLFPALVSWYGIESRALRYKKIKGRPEGSLHI